MGPCTMYLSVFYALQIGTRKKVPFIHSFAIDPNGTQIETPIKKGGETIIGRIQIQFGITPIPRIERFQLTQFQHAKKVPSIHS